MIMAKRITKDVKTIANRADAEEVVAQICRLTIEGDLLDANMDRELQEVRAEYQGRREAVASKLLPLIDAAASYYEHNPAELGPRRSLELTHGTVGFRTGMPKLKTLRGVTWAVVLERLKRMIPAYVRTSEEVNKEALIADRASLGAKLRDAGVEVVQEERFFVEPKRTDAKEVTT
jgi:phage host-nuclease inhibitor protein Gam